MGKMPGVLGMCESQILLNDLKEGHMNHETSQIRGSVPQYRIVVVIVNEILRDREGCWQKWLPIQRLEVTFSAHARTLGEVDPTCHAKLSASSINLAP